MKLTVDFSQLFLSARKMGITNFSEFSITSIKEPISPIGTSRGIEISLEELEIINGVFSYENKQVLLFIPDHSYNFDYALNDINRRNRYHITDCQTLEDMKTAGKFAKYHITTNTEGNFEITEFRGRKANVKLHICKNCLAKLNYKNYINNRAKVFNEFNLEECFTHYNPHFQETPAYKNQDKPGYAFNWEQISRNYRRSKNYCCESCNVNLSAYKQLLHTHHKDGNKQNNERSNLKAVCIECHSKEPYHQHLEVGISELNILSRLRKEQGISIETYF